MNRFAVNLPSGRVGRYAYPRYFFTNYSADISDRRSVALLDSFVGPKG